MKIFFVPIRRFRFGYTKQSSTPDVSNNFLPPVYQTIFYPNMSNSFTFGYTKRFSTLICQTFYRNLSNNFLSQYTKRFSTLVYQATFYPFIWNNFYPNIWIIPVRIEETYFYASISGNFLSGCTGLFFIRIYGPTFTKRIHKRSSTSIYKPISYYIK